MKIKNWWIAVCLALTSLLVPASSLFTADDALAACSAKCQEGEFQCSESSVRQCECVRTPAVCNVPANEKDAAGTEKGIMYYVKVAINVVLGIVGLVAVVMIIIGGINFIISQGEAAKVTKARNTILYGVIGLFVALLAFAIVNFVLSNVFGG